MRHLLHQAVTMAIAVLAQGMFAATDFGPLVPDPGPANGVTPGGLGARGRAVDVAPIAAGANTNLVTAFGTVEQAVGIDQGRHPCPGAGQVTRYRPYSNWDSDRDREMSSEVRSCYSGPPPFFASSVHAHKAPPQETRLTANNMATYGKSAPMGALCSSRSHRSSLYGQLAVRCGCSQICADLGSR